MNNYMKAGDLVKVKFPEGFSEDIKEITPDDIGVIIHEKAAVCSVVFPQAEFGPYSFHKRHLETISLSIKSDVPRH